MFSINYIINYFINYFIGYFIGYIVHKLLMSSIGARRPDDRDHYAQKRLDLAAEVASLGAANQPPVRVRTATLTAGGEAPAATRTSSPYHMPRCMTAVQAIACRARCRPAGQRSPAGAPVRP